MNKKERKLSPAELKRKAGFESKVQEMEQNGYVKMDLTIGIVKANFLAVIVMLPIMILFRLIYLARVKGEISVNFGSPELLLFLGVSLGLIVLHELIHGVTWAYMAKEGFQSIEFGIVWKMLTPYCTCSSELKKKQYILGAMMPTIVVGMLPVVIGIVLNLPFFYLIGQFMILGGGGDALIILQLLRHKENGKECVYLDHPYELGIVVFER
ncbi:MAG: DUF3267 domain-containing protein [bacterium]|nr:DUF3267 domain-containing protein [bacterium]